MPAPDMATTTARSFPLKMNSWHGITLQENFTYQQGSGHWSFGAGHQRVHDQRSLQPNNGYGLQAFDRKFVFNTYAMIEDPWYKGQHGIIGHIAGGWSLSPILAIGSGQPLGCGTLTDAQSFGAADGANFFTTENCVFTKGIGGGNASLHNNAGPGQFNIFADPAGLLATTRAPILGLDTNTGGVGVFRGLPYWNVDMRLVKDIHVAERVSLQFQYVVTNVFNHPVFADPAVGRRTNGPGRRSNHSIDVWRCEFPGQQPPADAVRSPANFLTSSSKSQTCCENGEGRHGLPRFAFCWVAVDYAHAGARAQFAEIDAGSCPPRSGRRFSPSFGNSE